MDCPICGKVVEEKRNFGGSRRKFCSVNCRVKNYRLNNLERVNKATKKYHSTTKSKFQMSVEAKLRYAVSTGKIKKPEICSVCEKPNKIIHGHHPDYNKPLEVIWVCLQCHVDIHQNRVQVPTW